jgi:hypothetical protein
VEGRSRDAADEAVRGTLGTTISTVSRSSGPCSPRHEDAVVFPGRALVVDTTRDVSVEDVVDRLAGRKFGGGVG